MHAYEPLISILIPCYNNQQFIYELLESVFIQTYHHIEILIGDDGSADFDSAQLEDWINKHQPEWLKRVSIYENEMNVGTVANIQNLQNNSVGEYLLNIAADDALYNAEVLEGFVRRINEIRNNGETASVIMAQLEMWNHTLDEKLEDFLSDEVIDTIKHGTSRDLFAKDSASCCLTAQYLYNRNILDKVGDLTSKYRLIEDWPTMLRLLRQDVKLHYMDNPPVAKHRDGGISHGHTLHSRYVYFQFYKEVIECYFNEVEPYEDLFTSDEKRLIREGARSRICSFRENCVRELEEGIQIEEGQIPFMIRIQKGFKNLLKKNMQMKYIWQFLFLTVFFYHISGYFLNADGFFVGVSCVSLFIALCGIVMKAWQIAKYRLRLF